jgi:hypothetical protein
MVEILKARRIRKTTDSQHVCALFEFFDPVHPRDETIGVDVDGYGRPDPDLWILARDHVSDGVAFIHLAAIVGCDRDRWLKKRKRIN